MSAREPIEVQAQGVLRFLTAGSVDDGKSTLIGRLLYDTKTVLADQIAAVRKTSAQRGQLLDLSLLTDGLTAEREQGITIDVAYRYFATARRKFIIADAPGHEQYTRNMVTAASTAQLAILLVDARHGVVQQTRRHATLAHLIGIPHLVVAINKMDLVGFDETAYVRIVNDFRVFAARAGIDDAALRFVPLSALGGDMVVDRGDRLDWYTGPTLLEILESAPIIAPEARAALRLPVQYVSRPGDDVGRSYQGRIEAGAVTVGQRIVVLPSGRATTVREIRKLGELVTSAQLHDPVALTLADEIDISRGDMLVAADHAPEAVRNVAATLCWLDERPLERQRTYLLRHTTREVRVRVDRLVHRLNINTQSLDEAPAALAMNDIGDVALTLAQPIVPDRYADNHTTGSFILIDEATNGTVAAGLIR